ncbi:MAG: ATP-binding cassette domain-containing protein [bacterium]
MKNQSITIHINELSKKYTNSKGIFNITTNFSSGNLNLLTGDNGSGKSTLIKCIMKLINYQGRIEKRRFRIGYAPENYIMPEYMTITEFLKAIGRIKHLYSNYLTDEIKAELQLFNLSDNLHKPIKKLSNGMKQKVNIIQALLNNPKIIILDEPLVGLDFDSQKILSKRMIKLSKEKLVIIATHYPEKFNTRTKKIYQFINGKLQ